MDTIETATKMISKETVLNNQHAIKNCNLARDMQLNSIRNSSSVEFEKNKINEENNKICLKNVERSLVDVKINKVDVLKEFKNHKLFEDDVKYKCWNHRKKNEIARERWKMLAKALLKPRRNSSKSVRIKDISVRRFTSFDLITPNKLDKLDKLDDCWLKYNTKIQNSKYVIDIHHLQQQLTAKELIGFNNTGNICIWPSEEVLTYYLLTNVHLLDGKQVLEVGGGMTCLAGVMLSKYGNPKQVALTDGNLISVENVQRILSRNQLDKSVVKASQLNWSDHEKITEKYDVVLSADCLFFDETRSDLVETIWHSLRDNGMALVMAPRRGNTLDLFVKEAIKKGFYCILQAYYHEVVWRQHLKFKESSPEYEEDLHYPILLTLTKSSQGLLVLNCLSSL